jgi:phosphopantetheinyl transferase
MTYFADAGFSVETIRTDTGILLIGKTTESIPRQPLAKKATERVIINTLLQRHLGNVNSTVSHHPNGQPFIENRPDLSVSVSHSNGWIALYLSEKETIGVDIQTYTSNLDRGRSWFLNAEETTSFAALSEHGLYVIWCAKEAFYKQLSGTISSLRDEVTVLPFDLQPQGTVRILYKENTYALAYLQDEEKTLVYT